MKKPAVSAVLITKNESSLLERCLGTLKDADEIVVLDTGSSDDTVAIAKNLGAEVFSIDKPIEPFHFAEARNQATRKAAGPWILSVDADEIVTSGGIDRLRKAILRWPKATAFRIPFTDRGMKTHKLKAYRKDSWKWKYRIHEQLVRRGFGDVQEADVHMEHLPPSEKEGRRKQNVELLRLCLKETPDHSVAWRQLGQELMLEGQYKEAIPFLAHYSERLEKNPIERSQAIAYIGYCHVHLKNIDRAILHFSSAHVVAPRRREPLFWGARVLYEAGRLDEAIRWLERTIAIPISERPGSRLDSGDAWSSAPADILETVKAQRAVENSSEPS